MHFQAPIAAQQHFNQNKMIFVCVSFQPNIIKPHPHSSSVAHELETFFSWTLNWYLLIWSWIYDAWDINQVFWECKVSVSLQLPEELSTMTSCNKVQGLPKLYIFAVFAVKEYAKFEHFLWYLWGHLLWILPLMFCSDILRQEHLLQTRDAQ